MESLSSTNLTENFFFMEFLEAAELMCILVVIDEEIKADGTHTMQLEMEIVTMVAKEGENEQQDITFTIESYCTTITAITDIEVADSKDDETQSIEPPVMVTTCDQFEDYENVAKRFVDTLLADVGGGTTADYSYGSSTSTSDAVESLESSSGSSSESSSSSFEFSFTYSTSSSSSSSSTITEYSSSSVEEESTQKSYFIAWPSIESFNEEYGLNTVRRYIRTVWAPAEEWFYNVYLLIQQSDKCADYYTYQTIWSLPNKEYPVPQVYASIYFLIKVSRIKPVNCSVDVCYYYEGCTYRLSPHNNKLNEDLLYNILKSKLNLYQRLTF